MLLFIGVRVFIILLASNSRSIVLQCAKQSALRVLNHLCSLCFDTLQFPSPSQEPSNRSSDYENRSGLQSPWPLTGVIRAQNPPKSRKKVLGAFLKKVAKKVEKELKELRKRLFLNRF